MNRPLVAACLAALCAAGCSRLSEHPLVVEAAEEVRQNRRVADLLGEPVTCSRSVSGVANETDGIAALRFEVRGPKASGTVVVEGKKTRNRWGVTQLELRPEGGGPHVDLSGDLVARTGTDTPKFDPAAPAGPSRAPPPPGEIEITLPPGPPGQ